MSIDLVLDWFVRGGHKFVRLCGCSCGPDEDALGYALKDIPARVPFPVTGNRYSRKEEEAVSGFRVPCRLQHTLAGNEESCECLAHWLYHEGSDEGSLCASPCGDKWGDVLSNNQPYFLFQIPRIRGNGLGGRSGSRTQ